MGNKWGKSSGSFFGSKQIPSKASALIVTGIVKVQSTSCQVPILFSTTDSWHEFDEKISKDVLDNKYLSYSISVVVVVFLNFLLRQEIIITCVNNSLSQMSQMSTNVTTLYE